MLPPANGATTIWFETRTYRKVNRTDLSGINQPFMGQILRPEAKFHLIHSGLSWTILNIEYLWIHMNTYEYLWIPMNTYEYLISIQVLEKIMLPTCQWRWAFPRFLGPADRCVKASTPPELLPRLSYSSHPSRAPWTAMVFRAGFLIMS